jgi:outer membrane protein insertion porin family
MVLKINVTEKSTGSFTFGAGYGNVESVFGTVSVAQRNLFGRGQKLELKATIGAKTTKYRLSFTEPYIYDMPLSGTVDAYNWQYAYDEYDKDTFGGGLSLNYPIFDYTRAYLSYSIDLSDISNVSDGAPGSIKEIKGENLKSAVSSALRYDSRNSNFVPTEGSLHSFSFEFAGLGGDVGFTKYIAATTYYYTPFWELTLSAHSEGGYVQRTRDKKLPDYEKFYMGGIGSMRGFERGDLAPKDDDGNEVGGDRYFQVNLDLLFPLLKEQGVYGGIFFDTGKVYDDDEKIEPDPGDLRQSAGLGFRWLSPMGPIRLEYGWILDPEDSDSGSGKWEFSMASAF